MRPNIKKTVADLKKTATNWSRELQNNPCYLVGGIVFLSLFLRISNPLFFNNLFSFIIITMLLNLGFHDLTKSVIFSAIIVVLMNLILSFGYSQEGYENLDDALQKLKALGESQHKDDTATENTGTNTDATAGASAGNTSAGNESAGNASASTGAVSEKPKIGGIPVVSLNGKKQNVAEFDQLSDQEKGSLYKNLNQDKKNVKRDSAVAQRDLFQLIDTVKQLQTTVDELGPTLKEGKKIMDAFENIKMDKI